MAVQVRLGIGGLVQVDRVAADLGVSRADVIRRAIAMSLPKLQQEADFVHDTNPVQL